MNLICIGIITNTSGINGTLLLEVREKNIFLSVGSPLYIGYSDNYTEKYILNKELHFKSKREKITLAGIDSIEKAIPLKEKAVFIEREAIQQENPNFVYQGDIIGCQVIDISTNQPIGTIIEV